MTREEREDAIKQCEDFIKHHSDWGVEVEWANGVEFVLEDYKRLIKQEPTTKNDLAVDCIDRAELLKAMDTWDKFGCDADTKLVPYQDHYIPYIHYDDVIKCIKSMPSVTPYLPSVTPQPRWIPVSERLPDKNMACLVAVGRFNFTQIAVYSDLMGIIDHQIFYQGDVGHDSFENITQYVKAWMPLPKSYKPQESEDT